MNNKQIFEFTTDISGINIPSKLNNPFAAAIPEIARIAAREFQEIISLESINWSHDFLRQKGKMFGILVVENGDKSHSYLGTVSGKLPGNAQYDRFIPSIFDDSTDDYFINRGMTELTQIGTQIKNTSNLDEINALKAESRDKSVALQQRLFENYVFSNLSGEQQNLIQIFEHSTHGKPPSAAGECAAPKLLQYAIENSLKPVALAEFWWGKGSKNGERAHGSIYPACKDRCRPILEFMLEDPELFKKGSSKS